MLIIYKMDKTLLQRHLRALWDNVIDIIIDTDNPDYGILLRDDDTEIHQYSIISGTSGIDTPEQYAKIYDLKGKIRMKKQV